MLTNCITVRRTQGSSLESGLGLFACWNLQQYLSLFLTDIPLLEIWQSWLPKPQMQDTVHSPWCSRTFRAFWSPQSLTLGERWRNRNSFLPPKPCATSGMASSPSSQQGAAQGLEGRSCDTWARPVASQPVPQQAAGEGGGVQLGLNAAQSGSNAELSSRCAQTCQVSVSGLGGDGANVTLVFQCFPAPSSEECGRLQVRPPQKTFDRATALCPCCHVKSLSLSCPFGPQHSPPANCPRASASSRPLVSSGGRQLPTCPAVIRCSHQWCPNLHR